MSPSPVVVQDLDGCPVRLRSAHDLGWLSELGQVFAVLDEQDSGNLCFGVDTGEQRLFVKYAGAEPVHAVVSAEEAVQTLRRAAAVHDALGGGPVFPTALDAFEVGDGYALVLPWTDAIPLGRQYGQHHRVRELDVATRVGLVQDAIEFHVDVARLGWVAIDFYDGSVMVSPEGRLTLCDLDFYRPGPVTNWMGRMYGSTRFMAPEEFELGAVLDEVTTQVALGALAHTLLGDPLGTPAEKDAGLWQAGDALLAVATQACRPERRDRHPSLDALARAWRAASEPQP